MCLIWSQGRKGRTGLSFSCFFWFSALHGSMVVGREVGWWVRWACTRPEREPKQVGRGTECWHEWRAKSDLLWLVCYQPTPLSSSPNLSFSGEFSKNKKKKQNPSHLWEISKSIFFINDMTRCYHFPFYYLIGFVIVIVVIALVSLHGVSMMSTRPSSSSNLSNDEDLVIPISLRLHRT